MREIRPSGLDGEGRNDTFLIHIRYSTFRLPAELEPRATKQQEARWQPLSGKNSYETTIRRITDGSGGQEKATL